MTPTVQMTNTVMRMSTVRTSTNVSMESICVVKMLIVKIQKAITLVVVRWDFTETGLIVLILMSATQEEINVINKRSA